MIKLNNVGFRYKNGNEILKNINLEIKEGECVCIVGKNGSGKSTLAKLIAGIEVPKPGAVLIDEYDTLNKDNFIGIRKKVGIVFQNPDNQILFNNVYEDLAFAIRNLKLDNEEIRIKENLQKVDMQNYFDKDIYELSLGQKQRITIASTLAINPKYLIFDEPTTMIDSEGKDEIYKIIKNLRKQKYTIIYVTNAIEEILMADRIIILERGEIVKDFLKENILDNIEDLKKHGIKVPKIVQALEICEKNNIDIKLEDWDIVELIEKILEVIKNERPN